MRCKPLQLKININFEIGKAFYFNNYAWANQTTQSQAQLSLAIAKIQKMGKALGKTFNDIVKEGLYL